MIKVGFKKLDTNSIIPVKAHATDSGFDLFANEDIVIGPGETVVVKTGIAVHLPPLYEAQVRPRSGITKETKLRVQLGTIDNDYTGEIGISVDNIFPVNHPHANNSAYGDYHIHKGDKLAQLVIAPIPVVETYEIEKLPNTERGSNGFGSSGY